MCSPGPVSTVVECSTELWRQLGSPVPDLIHPNIQLELIIRCIILAIILINNIRSPSTTQHHSLQIYRIEQWSKCGYCCRYNCRWPHYPPRPLFLRPATWVESNRQEQKETG